MGERWQQLVRGYQYGQGPDWASRIASGNAYLMEQDRLEREKAAAAQAAQDAAFGELQGQSAYLTGQMLPSQAIQMVPQMRQFAAPAVQSYEALQQAFGPTPTPEQAQVLGTVREFAGTQPGATVGNLRELEQVAAAPESPSMRLGYLKAQNAGLLSEQAARQKAEADAAEEARRQEQKQLDRAWQEGQSAKRASEAMERVKTLAGQQKPLDPKTQAKYQSIVKGRLYLDRLEKMIYDGVPSDWNPLYAGADTVSKAITGNSPLADIASELKTFYYTYKPSIYGEAEPNENTKRDIEQNIIPNLATDNKAALLSKINVARRQIDLEEKSLQQSARAGGMAMPGAMSTSTQQSLIGIVRNGSPAAKAEALMMLQEAGIYVDGGL